MTEVRIIAAAIIASGFGTEALTESTAESLAKKATGIADAIAAKAAMDEAVRDQIARDRRKALLDAAVETERRQTAARAREAALQGIEPPSGSEGDGAKGARDTNTNREPHLPNGIPDISKEDI